MQIIERVEHSFWMEVAERCSYATFFHTPHWQELALAMSPGQQDATLGVVLPNGVRVVLPLLAKKRFGPWRELHSAAAGCYGGLIADGPVDQQDALRIYRAACNWRTTRFQITTNPLAESVVPPGACVQQDVTHALRLDTNFETVFNAFAKSHQAYYTCGVRGGVAVRRAQSVSDYAAYFGVYRATLRRWTEQGGVLHGSEGTWSQFGAGAALARRHPEAIQLWLAEVGGRVAAGAWVCYWNGNAIYWHGAAHEAFLNLHPSVVLHTEIIRDALERGCGVYDFNASGGLAGLAEFKRRFGAEQRPVPRWSLGEGTFALARTVCARLQAARAS